MRPGTDGLFVLSLVHELLQADRIDLDFLARYTNAAWLVIRNPGGADDGLFARDADGRPLAWDRTTSAAIDAATPEHAAADRRRDHAARWAPRAAGVPSAR